MAFPHLLEGGVHRTEVSAEGLARDACCPAPSTAAMLPFVPGIVELMLFKEWCRDAETVSNEESRRWVGPGAV